MARLTSTTGATADEIIDSLTETIAELTGEVRAARRERDEAIAALEKAPNLIPTNWLDPLLSSGDGRFTAWWKKLSDKEAGAAIRAIEIVLPALKKRMESHVRQIIERSKQ